MEEIWKDVVGYESQYEVSNLGRVKSNGFFYQAENNITCAISPRILKQRLNNDGYPVVGLKKNKKNKTLRVHRLMAIAFLPNPENKTQVNHKNGIRHDCTLENIEWNTPQENIRHSFDVLNREANRKGILNTKSSKIIYQHDENGVFIKEFPSVQQASRDLGIHCDAIYSSKRFGHATYGFKFSYEKLPQPQEQQAIDYPTIER